MSPALVNGHNGGTTSPGMFSTTQRRGPIAAEFQGPGPAAVSLPSTIGKSADTFSIIFLYTLNLIERWNLFLVPSFKVQEKKITQKVALKMLMSFFPH